MRDVQDYIEKLKNFIQSSYPLRYAYAGDEHERRMKWWINLLFLIDDIDKQYHTNFRQEFHENLFLPGEELKRQLQIPEQTPQYEIEQMYMHNGFRVGIEKTRTLTHGIIEWLQEHGNTAHPLFALQQENLDIVMQRLVKLLKAVPNPDENIFLQEVIKCCAIGAWRSAIVMMWNLTIDHLYRHVMTYELDRFNKRLQGGKLGNITITNIQRKEDFLEIPEFDFLRFCYESRIIEPNLHDTLKENLTLRNRFAHPSSIKVNDSKVLSMAEELVKNVITVFKID